jgi:hypothetical protein
MNDQDMQAQFIQWLAQKTGAKTEEELKQVVERLQSDEPTMQKVMAQFQSEVGEGQAAASQFAEGGKLDYLDCLNKMKKGGKMDCGCNKKVAKGLVGMIAKAATLIPKVAGLAKTAKPVLSLGQKALKFGMDNKNAILGTIQGGMDLAKSARGSKNTDSTVVTPSTGNDYYGANAGAIQSPQMLSMQRQVPVFTGNDIPNGGVTNTQPKLIEKGGKLKKKKFAEGGILFADKGARVEKRVERKIERKDRNLVGDYNLSKATDATGIYPRAKNKFNVAEDIMANARRPLDRGDAKGSYQPSVKTVNPKIEAANFSSLKSREESAAPASAKATPESFKTRGDAFKAARAELLKGGKNQNSGTFTFGGKSYTTEMAGEAKPGKPLHDAVSTLPIAKQIRVPNEQYPGSTTIMPENGIGEVVVTAPRINKQAFLPNGLPVINLPKRPANMENTPTTVRVPAYTGNNTGLINNAPSVNPLNPLGGMSKGIPPIQEESSIQAWVRQYGEAKAKGDKIGMKHWQDLLETAGGEGRPQK